MKLVLSIQEAEKLIQNNVGSVPDGALVFIEAPANVQRTDKIDLNFKNVMMQIKDTYPGGSWATEHKIAAIKLLREIMGNMGINLSLASAKWFIEECLPEYNYHI